MYSSEDESSELSDLEERVDEKIIAKLPWGESGPRLSKDEIKLRNTYTYDKEPVKAWRQTTDYMVLRECNEFRWYEITKFLGEFSGFRTSHLLYQNPSRLCNLIEIIICKNKCYFLPDKCFLKHGFDLKILMSKSLHDQQPSEFKALFKESNCDLKIEHDIIGRPNLWKLAEEIGFNTPLEYDDDGFLKIDYSVFEETYWNTQRPAFVTQEKKVLDIIHGLLISSSQKQGEEVAEAQKLYSQNLPGLNNPSLKSMCHGPDAKFEFVDKNTDCDILSDENKVNILYTNVEHPTCSDFKDENHWKYQHDETVSDTSECKTNNNHILEGPVCERDSTIVHYPCNLKHCWECCKCKLCKLAKIVICKDHKEHINFNIKNCIIQEHAQCQDHWVDHIENFNDDEDIKVELNIFFHKNQLIKNGRNYRFKTIKYSGLKVKCKKCRRNTNDHLSNHLTPHMQCKHCIYEMKTMVDQDFWGKVCNICGKVFDSKAARYQHARRYNVPEQVCELCEMKCSSKFNLKRHMTEQHNTLQEDYHCIENEQPYKCDECKRSFNYQRNLKLHVDIVHGKQEDYKCLLCTQEIKTKRKLKRHLEEQHMVFDLENPIQTKEIVIKFVCDLCERNFKRKEHLLSHMKTHSASQSKVTCTTCGKQFVSQITLDNHQVVHSRTRGRFICDTCQKTFSSKGNLGRHIQGIHAST